MSFACSNEIFSSCLPSSALIAGVKIGSGKRDANGIPGGNAGYSRTISSFVSEGAVTVKLAFLSPVAAGDQFQLLPGCDRTLATCTNVFNNAIHFGGFPYIPPPETAV